MHSTSKVTSILDIDSIAVNNEFPLDTHLQDISSITFEYAVNTVLVGHTEIDTMLSEINRVDREIIAYRNGECTNIHTDGSLTFENSISLFELRLNPISLDKDTILERAYEYIRALINKIIIIIKTTFTKYMAVHSKHVEIAKEYMELMSGIDLINIDNTSDLDIFKEIGTIFDIGTNIMSPETMYFISSSDTVKNIIEKIKDYGNYTAIVRPPDKIIFNTVSSELGSARADIMQDWANKSTTKFNDIFIKKPSNAILVNNVKSSTIISDIHLDTKDISKYTPFTTDGVDITCIYLTTDFQLRIMRMAMKDIPRDKMVNIENIKPILHNMSNTDIGKLVKEDIYLLERIESDAKIYFKQVNTDLGTDHGKRSSAFNNTVTMVNAALAISNNRMKLSNNILSVAEKIILKYKG